MSLRIVSGTANPELAAAIGSELGVEPTPCEVSRFPDGEIRPVVGHVRGADVYVVQPTGPPVNEHLLELFLLLDACRRGGAGRVTAVTPYFGYARQDRRGRSGEAVGARVAADALAGAGAQRLVVVDPHTAALESMCAIPVEMLTAVPVLAADLAAELESGAEADGPAVDGAVVVAPDLGASKLAEHYASLLGWPVAVVRKTRLTGTTVSAEELVGDVRGRRPVVVDDMISTGGTVEAAARVLVAHGAVADAVVVATHGLLVGPAAERLAGARPRLLVITDTVAPAPAPGVPVRTRSVAPLLAEVVGRLHRDDTLDDLLLRA